MCSRIHKSLRSSAFTLVEMLVAMGVGGLALLAIGTLTLYTGRSFAGLLNYADLDNRSRNALDVMTRDIRQAKWLNSFTSNKLEFVDWDDKTLAFTYNPTAKTLVRTREGEADQTLLIECDTLRFRIYQRNTVGGTYDLYSPTNSDLCKAVDLNWVCSRRILGARLNTESVQTARIVIRKH